jgi:tetratricopeptide (TPR) repeat protein
MTAFVTALACGPAAEASALAHEVLDGDGLKAFDITAPVALGCTVLTLGEPAEGVRAKARYAEHARRQGEILGSIGADLWGGFARIWTGDLVGAIASLERAQEGERLWGTKLDAVMGYSAAFLALAWLERGYRDVAWEALEKVDASDGISDGARFWLSTRARLLVASDRAEEAVAVTERLEGMRPPETHPLWAPWRVLRAEALHALGRTAEASALAEDELALARRIGAPWLTGRALRRLAALGGPHAVDRAREAIVCLEGTSARLELAHAHAVLADASPSPDEAATSRARALDLARTCGADGLAAHLEAGPAEAELAS